MSKRIKHHNCDMTNSHHNFSCIEKFMAHKLKCSVPWETHFLKEYPLKCTNLTEYYHLRLEIYNRKMDLEMLQFGCSVNPLIPDCHKNTWIPAILAASQTSEKNILKEALLGIAFNASARTQVFPLIFPEVGIHQI